MKQIKKEYSLEENLKDTKHNRKANIVFMKLLANNKCKANPWDVWRSETLIPDEKSDIALNLLQSKKCDYSAGGG